MKKYSGSMKGKVSDVAFDSTSKRPLVLSRYYGGTTKRALAGGRKNPFRPLPCAKSYITTEKIETASDLTSLNTLLDGTSSCNSETLFEDNKHLYYASLFNPFVQDLAHGGLPKDIFDQYLSQDVYYLGVFEDALATMHELIQLDIGVNEVNRHEAKERALSLLNSVEKEIEAVHGSFIKVENRDDTSWATEAYTDFLKKVQTDPNSSVAEILASLLPCFRLYAEIARYLEDNILSSLEVHEKHPYADWIREYASPKFLEYVHHAEWIFNMAATRDARVTGMFEVTNVGQHDSMY